MHPDLENLIVLQRYDVEAKRLRDEIAALPRSVAALEAKRKTLDAQRQVVLDLLAQEEALRRRQESDVQDHQAKATRIHKQLDLATTSVQVTAYEHELAFATAEITRLEDAELESMQRTEDMEAQRTRADSAVESASTQLERERERATQTIARDRLDVAEVDAKRIELRPLIGEATLSIYDRIAKAKGTGLSEGVDQKCSACQMLVRPQKWNDLRDRSDHETLFTCESCGRLLYWDPARDAPQRKPAEPEESIAARIVRSL